MNLTINGQKRQVEAGASVAALLLMLGINPSQVAVERNGGIVPKSAWAGVQLQGGDEVEIVQFIGGG